MWCPSLISLKNRKLLNPTKQMHSLKLYVRMKCIVELPQHKRKEGKDMLCRKENCDETPT
jgi:hypothetical protein